MIPPPRPGVAPDVPGAGAAGPPAEMTSPSPGRNRTARTTIGMFELPHSASSLVTCF